MIDGAAGKVGELGAGGGDAGLPLLIGIADDRVGVGYVKIVANQGDAEGRIEVVQEDGSHLGDAIAIGVAQQRDAVGARCLGTGEPLDPAGDDILRPEYRRLRTIALDH